MEKIVITFVLLLLTGCQNREQLRNLTFLRIGVLYQQAQSIKEEKKRVPLAWSLFLSLKGEKDHCFYLKQNKSKYDLRVVRKTQANCDFEHDIIAEIYGIDKVEYIPEKDKHQLVFKDENHQYTFTSQKDGPHFLWDNSVFCGKRKMPACYRGKSYKKNLITTCTQYNEEYFCADGLNIYCNQGKYECL